MFSYVWISVNWVWVRIPVPDKMHRPRKYNGKSKEISLKSKPAFAQPTRMAWLCGKKTNTNTTLYYIFQLYDLRWNIQSWLWDLVFVELVSLPRNKYRYSIELQAFDVHYWQDQDSSNTWGCSFHYTAH